jgi:hypothetical protein
MVRSLTTTALMVRRQTQCSIGCARLPLPEGFRTGRRAKFRPILGLKLRPKNSLCLIVLHPKRRTTKMNSELAHMKTSDLGRHLMDRGGVAAFAKSPGPVIVPAQGLRSGRWRTQS